MLESWEMGVEGRMAGGSWKGKFFFSFDKVNWGDWQLEGEKMGSLCYWES